MYKLNILSLGAGVQSTAIYFMSMYGDLPHLDCAIFADTGWESLHTYSHLEWMRSVGTIPIIIVSKGSIKDEILFEDRFASMPFYILNKEGKQGMSKRQCTLEYKIRPIKKKMRELLGVKYHQWAPKDAVEEWIGISTDEAKRARIYKSDRMTSVKFPLIEYKPMTRIECIDYLKKKFPDREIKRSSCIGCPYKKNEEWLSLPREEFKEAVEFDYALRTRENKFDGVVFLHESLKPLDEVDFRSADNKLIPKRDVLKNILFASQEPLWVEGRRNS